MIPTHNGSATEQWINIVYRTAENMLRGLPIPALRRRYGLTLVRLGLCKGFDVMGEPRASQEAIVEWWVVPASGSAFDVRGAEALRNCSRALMTNGTKFEVTLKYKAGVDLG
jgi:hypothetical protein